MKTQLSRPEEQELTAGKRTTLDSGQEQSFKAGKSPVRLPQSNAKWGAEVGEVAPSNRSACPSGCSLGH